MSKDKKQKRFKVFLSYVSNDKEIAQRIASQLGSSDIKVWFDAQEMHFGDSLISKVRDAISASDYLVVLLSKDSVKSPWVHYELGHALSDLSKRDITLLPVRVDDCEIPPTLAEYHFIDLRGDFEKGLSKLTKIISVVPDVDFGKLNPHSFESLVGELLWKTGFDNVRTASSQRDTGVDLIAEYKTSDPFGFEENKMYFIQCKLYRQSRADLKSLHQFVDALKNIPEADEILLVTNSQLTSAAYEWLKAINQKERISVRVISGTKLKRLLLKYNDLVSKYFPADEGEAS